MDVSIFDGNAGFLAEADDPETAMGQLASAMAMARNGIRKQPHVTKESP